MKGKMQMNSPTFDLLKLVEEMLDNEEQFYIWLERIQENDLVNLIQTTKQLMSSDI